MCEQGRLSQALSGFWSGCRPRRQVEMPFDPADAVVQLGKQEAVAQDRRVVIGYSLAQAPDIGFNIAHPSIKTCDVLLKPGNVLLKPGNIARHALKAAALLGLRHDDLLQHDTMCPVSVPFPLISPLISCRPMRPAGLEPATKPL